MGIISFLSGILSKTKTSEVDFCAAYSEMMAEACYRELALTSAVNLIANAISKCEFKIYDKGNEIKDEEWYLWNVEPNKNQNSTAFLRELINTLYRKNEVLVVEVSGQLLIADSYQHDEYAVKEDVFSNISIGELTLRNSYKASDVLFWRLSDNNLNQLMQIIYSSYSKLLSYTMASYQISRGVRGKVKINAIPPGQDDNAYLLKQQEKYLAFLKASTSVIAEGSGTEFELVDKGKTYSNEGTRDIRHMIDDISDFTAKLLSIPPALLRGDVQGVSDALDDFLTFCIDPLVDFLREEIVRKRIGRKANLAGYDLQIDTKQIKHIDLLSVATAIDKLIGSGSFCINDIRKLVGESIIDEPWAWEHRMTKNYAPIEEILVAQKGGE